MTVRYKDPTLQENYEGCIKLFDARHRTLFAGNGQPHRLNAVATSFWRGYFNEEPTCIPRNTQVWTYYQAGRTCGKRRDAPKFETNGQTRWN